MFRVNVLSTPGEYTRRYARQESIGNFTRAEDLTLMYSRGDAEQNFYDVVELFSLVHERQRWTCDITNLQIHHSTTLYSDNLLTFLTKASSL